MDIEDDDEVKVIFGQYIWDNYIVGQCEPSMLSALPADSIAFARGILQLIPS